MWSTRIVESVKRAGATAIGLDSEDELTLALEAEGIAEHSTIGGVIVDLNGRGYDGAAAIARVHEALLPVIAVAQHDDQLTRKRALGAGASRVFSYQKFFTDGAALVRNWLAAADTDPTSDEARGTGPAPPTSA